MAKILIAYERESESSMLDELLTGRGHRVVRYGNGIEALEAARREPPDLVLSDILLPKMDGFALCRKWKQDERLQSIPFIFFTTRHDDPKYERFAEELNADRFLARPSEPDALVNAVDELLARRSSSGTGTERLPVLNEANVRLSAQVLELQAQTRQLVESTSAYRDLFDASPCPQWVTDQQTHRPVLVNDAALELLGYSRDEFLGLTSTALDGRATASALLPGLQVLRRKDGHSLAVLRDTRVHDYRGRGAEISAACDLTEHAEAFARLEAELKLQRTILEAAPDGFLLTNIDGNVLDANPAYCKLSGYSKAELLKRKLSDLESTGETDGSPQTNKATSTRYAATHRHKSGVAVDVEVTSHDLPGAELLRVLSVRLAAPQKEDLVPRRLAALLEVQQASAGLDEPALMGLGAELAASILNSPVAAVVDISPSEKSLEVVARFADGQLSTERPNASSKSLGKTGIWAECAKSGLPQLANTGKKAVIDGLPGIERCVVIPLRDGDETTGLLVVANRASDYSEAEKLELGAFADGLWNTVKARRLHLGTLRELQRADIAMESLIATLSRMIDIHDPHTAGSAARVAVLAVALGRELGLDGKRQHVLRIAGLLHDIGTMLIPPAILGKPQLLTEQEMALVRTHPVAGKGLLSSIDFNAPVADIVEQHHERFDGSGYPHALKGETILIEARVLAVADVVEAMCSKRAERPALGLDAALEELERNSGRLYDARVAKACIRLFREHGFQLTS
ncbi:MAG: HD domain-containing phosphohydrolase [Steroidobacteraceae bacterium]